MKYTLILTMIAMINVSQAAQVLTCKSRDFDPANYDGQALKITLDGSNRLIEAAKVEGSWFGDTGMVSNPKVLAKSAQGTIYEVNFNNDDYNGRVIVPNTSKISSVVYQFSYADDERVRRDNSVLYCK